MRFKVDGLEEVKRKMERLSRRSSARVQKKSVRAGAVVAQRIFRSVSPVGPTGNLKRAQTIKPITYKSSNTSVAVVGADYKIAPHSHLIEWGTKDRYRKKFARHPKRGFTGKMTPTRMYENAFNSVRPAIEREMQAELQHQLELELANQ